MSVEISSIENAALRHAAEVADLNDDTANSGKLDQKELLVFIREAVNANCSKDEIAELCNQVGLEHAADDVLASMQKLNQLQKLEKELEYQRDILNKRDDEITKLTRKDNAKSLGTIGGSAAIGGIIGCAVGGPAGGLIGSFAGFLVGAVINHMTGDDSQQISEFEYQKTPIEDKVRELSAQMEEIQRSL